MFGEHATKQVVAAASKRVPGSNGVAVVDGSSLFFSWATKRPADKNTSKTTDYTKNNVSFLLSEGDIFFVS